MLLVVVRSSIHNGLRLFGRIVVPVDKQPGEEQGEHNEGSDRNADDQSYFGIMRKSAAAATARGSN